MRPHLCMQRGGALKKGCAACAKLYMRKQRARASWHKAYMERTKESRAAYWRNYRATHRNQQRVYQQISRRRHRKVNPMPLRQRVRDVFKLGFALSVTQLHAMLGCPHLPTLESTCFKLQREGLIRHERTKQGNRGGLYKVERWLPV